MGGSAREGLAVSPSERRGNWKTELNFGSNSVVINAKQLDDKTINEAADKIFHVVEKKVKDSGLGFVRV